MLNKLKKVVGATMLTGMMVYLMGTIVTYANNYPNTPFEFNFNNSQCYTTKRDKTDTEKPKNSDPVSPIKTLAGYTLNRRNPISPPTTAPVTGSIPLPIPMETTVKKTATISVTLDARPSSPSVKFTPFTVPITAKKRTGIASQPRFR